MEERHANLSSGELITNLRLVRTSLECPGCTAPLGDVSGRDHVKCTYCGEAFDVASINKESRDDLSYKKLKILAETQMTNVTMSSRMDIQYDPDRYVDRPQAQEVFQRFLEEHSLKKKLFLLLGEAGFGKTWLVAHLANQLQENGYPVFYLRLSEHIDSFFELVFEQNRTESMRKIRSALDITADQRPLVWIMDGYDEMFDLDDRVLLLTDFLKLLDKSSNQLMVLSSRAYDWRRCLTRQDQDALIQSLMWKENTSAEESFHLVRYSEEERSSARFSNE